MAMNRIEKRVLINVVDKALDDLNAQSGISNSSPYTKIGAYQHLKEILDDMLKEDTAPPAQAPEEHHGGGLIVKVEIPPPIAPSIKNDAKEESVATTKKSTINPTSGARKDRSSCIVS
jgi:hypothetical protein